MEYNDRTCASSDLASKKQPDARPAEGQCDDTEHHRKCAQMPIRGLDALRPGDPENHRAEGVIKGLGIRPDAKSLDLPKGCRRHVRRPSPVRLPPSVMRHRQQDFPLEVT